MDDAPVDRRRTALDAGLVLILLAGQPAFLGDQVFTTGWVLRGVVFALVTAVALLWAWQAARERPRLGPWRWALLALPLGIALCGLPAFGEGWAHAARAGRTWILAPLLALALLWTWRGAGDAARGLRWLVHAGALAALLVLLDRLGGFVAAGPFGRAGVAGPVLGALVGPALLLGRGRRSVRIATVALLVLGCLATGSRTGVAAAVLGGLAALAGGLPDAAWRKRARIAWAGLGTVGVILLALMLEGRVPIPGPDATLEVRMGLHRGSVEAIDAAPMRGHGLGSYPVMMLRYRDVAEARLEPDRRAFHAHNDVLHAMVEGGVPAGALLAICLIGFAWLALRGPRADARARAVGGACLGIVITLTVAGFGDGVLVDPAPALLLAVAMAGTLLAAAPPRTRSGAAAQVPVLAGAAVALLIAYVLARDAVADAHLMRYRHAITGHPTLAARTRAAARFAEPALEHGALRWRPDHPEALYRLGAFQASTKRYLQARESFRKALEADPGLTEARLDLAQVYALEERGDDARTVLDEAARHDPTRYAIPRRQGDLLLGPEPVPGDPPGAFDDLAILRQLNEARALAPARFENLVDEARYLRRRALDGQDLRKAGAKLREAMAAAPGDPANPPAEILLESFHLAETEGQPLLLRSTILMQALARNPAPALRYRAQADRFLDKGGQREAKALKVAGDDPRLLDMRSAQRAFDAAAVRYTALLYVGLADPEAVLATARLEAEAGRFRRALALYRSLLAWTLPPKEGKNVQALRGDARLESIARQGNLLIEAAKVAQRVDRPLASFYRTRGQLRIGVELLEKGKDDMARMKLQSAVDADPELADGHFALARALARLEEEPRAEWHLLEALRLKPALKGPALAAPDLKTVRRRAKVKLRLGIP